MTPRSSARSTRLLVTLVSWAGLTLGAGASPALAVHVAPMRAARGDVIETGALLGVFFVLRILLDPLTIRALRRLRG